MVTFKNAIELQEAIKRMDASSIVTETDSPFLAPVPFRGKTNETSYLPYIVRSIGQILDLPEEDVMRFTEENARRLYPKLQT